MKIFISNQLLKLLKLYDVKENGSINGDIYGLTEIDDHLYLLTLCSASHRLQHDPTLLFSSSFTKLGIFHIDSKDLSSLNLQEHRIALCHIEDQLSVYSYDTEKNEVRNAEYDVFDESDLIENFVLARICFSLEFCCGDKTADVKNVISTQKDIVGSNNSFFKSRQFSLLIQNKSKKRVLSFVEGNTKKYENVTIGSLYGNSKRKKHNFDSITFDLYENKSRGPASAPVVKITYDKVNILRTSLSGQAVTYVPKSLILDKVGDYLSKAVTQHLQLSEFWLLKQISDGKMLSPLQTYPVKHYLLSHLLTPIYPRDCSEDHLQGYRSQIHKDFLLPSTIPILKKLNRFSFYGDAKTVHVLVNPHYALTTSAVGEVSIVQGLYGYHHYMQDKFNDNKWGCAYRSLQTLISWFRMQGYTDEPIPTHRKIQQVLVDMKDKPYSFIGSKEWIGSTEVGFVLDSLLKVSCKFIYVSSGSELETKGRELSMHFEHCGTPIMIGGGALAHTILGVDWNCDTGDIKFLILDPHYTGGEDLQTITKNGWCGWKGPNFWNANSYYNLCLPQRPKVL